MIVMIVVMMLVMIVMMGDDSYDVDYDSYDVSSMFMLSMSKMIQIML